MLKHRSPVKKRVSASTDEHPRLTIRLATPEERKLIEDAAFGERLSVNAWLSRIALEAAKKTLKRIAATS